MAMIQGTEYLEVVGTIGSRRAEYVRAEHASVEVRLSRWGEMAEGSTGRVAGAPLNDALIGRRSI